MKLKDLDFKSPELHLNIFWKLLLPLSTVLNNKMIILHNGLFSFLT